MKLIEKLMRWHHLFGAWKVRFRSQSERPVHRASRCGGEKKEETRRGRLIAAFNKRDWKSGREEWEGAGESKERGRREGVGTT